MGSSGLPGTGVLRKKKFWFQTWLRKAQIGTTIVKNAADRQSSHHWGTKSPAIRRIKTYEISKQWIKKLCHTKILTKSLVTQFGVTSAKIAPGKVKLYKSSRLVLFERTASNKIMNMPSPHSWKGKSAYKNWLVITKIISLMTSSNKVTEATSRRNSLRLSSFARRYVRIKPKLISARTARAKKWSALKRPKPGPTAFSFDIRKVFIVVQFTP